MRTQLVSIRSTRGWLPRISPKNSRIGGIQERTARREDAAARGEVVIADAWVALRSPPITHQSRAGDPSGARARRPVRSSAALIRHGQHSRIHAVLVRTERKKKRGRQGEVTPATIVRARVRACEIRIIRRDTCITRGKQQCTHAVYRVTLYTESGLERERRPFCVVSVSLGEKCGGANKQGPRG